MLVLLATCSAVLGREWIDAQGRKVEGTFVRFEDGKVLILSGGQTVEVAFDRLSAADQDFVRTLLESRGQADLLPPPTNPTQPATPAPPVPALDPSVQRTWTDRDGQQLVARFNSVIGDEVLLQQASGTRRILFAKLSDDDQNLIRQYLESRGQGDLTPAAPGDSPTAKVQPWTAEDGARFDAKFRHVVTVTDTDKNEVLTVVLQGRDRTITMPFAKLSSADAAYVRRELESQGLADLLPTNSSTVTSPTPPASGTAHVWTDSRGTQFSGNFVRIAENNIVINEATGGQITIQGQFLVQADLNYIFSQLESRDPPPAAGRTPYRIWKYNQNPELQTVARFDQYSAGTVQLRQEGSFFTVRFVDLSLPDRQYLRRLLEAEGRGSELPPENEPIAAQPAPSAMPTTPAPKETTQSQPTEGTNAFDRRFGDGQERKSMFYVEEIYLPHPLYLTLWGAAFTLIVMAALIKLIQRFTS